MGVKGNFLGNNVHTFKGDVLFISLLYINKIEKKTIENFKVEVDVRNGVPKIRERLGSPKLNLVTLPYIVCVRVDLQALP